jgi:hypothetical protein
VPPKCNSKSLPHLEEALANAASPYRLVATYKHYNREGETRLYELPNAPPVPIEAVGGINFPEKSL